MKQQQQQQQQPKTEINKIEERQHRAECVDIVVLELLVPVTITAELSKNMVQSNFPKRTTKRKKETKKKKRKKGEVKEESKSKEENKK